MHRLWQLLVLLGLTAGLAGCGGKSPAAATTVPAGLNPGASAIALGGMAPGSYVDADKVRSADYSLLFVGNSHTMMFDMPGLVSQMIEFGQPGKKACAYYHGVGFLEHAANDETLKGYLEDHSWKFVILQAQKISMSGRHEYSRKEGINLAKQALSKGAKVFYFCEWGRKGITEEGPRTERIYRAMADAAGADVSPIGRAWDVALSERPDLALHSGDGNHQSEIGAFLTGCVLYGSITGESPVGLASYPYDSASPADRKFLADAAARGLKPKGAETP